MQKRTRSILEELDSLYVERDLKMVIETRAGHLIESAIRLIEQIESAYTPEQAENLTRKLLNAIKNKDSNKFARSARRAYADS